MRRGKASSGPLRRAWGRRGDGRHRDPRRPRGGHRSTSPPFSCPTHRWSPGSGHRSTAPSRSRRRAAPTAGEFKESPLSARPCLLSPTQRQGSSNARKDRRMRSSYGPRWPIPRSPVVSAALLAGTVCFVVLLTMFVRGWKSVPVDKVALHYTGGPIQGPALRTGGRSGDPHPLLRAA